MKVLMLDMPYNTKLVFPAELSAAAATLLAQATLVKSDYNTGYSPAGKDEKLAMEFVDSSIISVVTDREQAMANTIEAKDKRWLSEYQDHQNTKKLVEQLRAEIEGIRSVTTCTVAETETPVTDDRGPGVDFRNADFF